MHHSKAAGCQPAGVGSGQHGPGHSSLIGVQVPGMNIFPKTRKPHNNEKCWNTDIIRTCDIRPASASKLCPKYAPSSPNMTIFSQIVFCQWLVEPAEETMFHSASVDGDQTCSAPEFYVCSF